MLLHACGGFPGASRPSRGASRSLQGLQGSPGGRRFQEAPGLRGLRRDGQAGRSGGRVSPTGVEGVFKGI